MRKQSGVRESVERKLARNIIGKHALVRIFIKQAIKRVKRGSLGGYTLNGARTGGFGGDCSTGMMRNKALAGG